MLDTHMREESSLQSWPSYHRGASEDATRMVGETGIVHDRGGQVARKRATRLDE